MFDDKAKTLSDVQLNALAQLDMDTLRTLADDTVSVLQNEATWDEDEPVRRMKLLDMAQGIGDFLESVDTSVELARQELANRKNGGEV